MAFQVLLLGFPLTSRSRSGRDFFPLLTAKHGLFFPYLCRCFFPFFFEAVFGDLGVARET